MERDVELTMDEPEHTAPDDEEDEYPPNPMVSMLCGLVNVQETIYPRRNSQRSFHAYVCSVSYSARYSSSGTR